MSCFKLLKGLVKELEILIRIFFFWRILNIFDTHTHTGRGEKVFKETYSNVYPKWPLIRKFWWGYSGDNRNVHWVKWERLREAKEVGGLGFK